MTILETLNKQLEVLEAVLKSTKELEKRQRTNRRTHYQQKILITSLRATSYVMLYNAIELSMRSIMKSIREKIEAEEINYNEASEFWRLDLLQSHFLEKMQSGTNHGNLLVDVVPVSNSRLSWDEPKKDRLPFSGNFGQTAAMTLRDRLALDWKAPVKTLNGSDLENIRERRNALAHGLETFLEAGDKVTAEDLINIVERVKTFMLSYIEALEKYRDERRYLLTQPQLPDNVANL